MNILIADDHAIVREGIKNLLATIPSVTHVDEAADGEETLLKVKSNGFDLLILDISLPGISGLDLLQKLRDSNKECRTLIISLHPEEHYASRAFKLGAVGYLSKNTSYHKVKEAIQKVLDGGRYVSDELAEKLAFGDNDGSPPHEKLSEREFQVMLLLAKGKSVSEIAEQTFISDKTVSTYRTRILKKLDQKSNAGLTIYAIKNGLIV